MGGVADQRAGLARSRGHRNRRWRPARAPCARSWRSWPRTRPRRAPPPPALRTCGVMAFGGGDMGTALQQHVALTNQLRDQLRTLQATLQNSVDGHKPTAL